MLQESSFVLLHLDQISPTSSTLLMLQLSSFKCYVRIIWSSLGLTCFFFSPDDCTVYTIDRVSLESAAQIEINGLIKLERHHWQTDNKPPPEQKHAIYSLEITSVTKKEKKKVRFCL